MLKFLTYKFSLYLTTVFLTWLVGDQKLAANFLESGELVGEQDVAVFPSDVSSAITEDPVKKILHSFKLLFTEDAWSHCLSLGIKCHF